MDRTTIMAYFQITGDYFPTSEITEKLSIAPTESYTKGDYAKNNIIKKVTFWSISTGYEESLDINDQLEKIISKLSSKRETLNELKKVFGLKFRFMIVMRIFENDKPAMYLEENTIHFASEIEADFHFDYYIFES